MADNDHKSKIGYFNKIVGVPDMPWANAVAMNRVEGWRPWRKFGANDAVGNSFEDIWAAGGTYPTVTTTETLSLVSSSAQDDAAAEGTGAWTVRVEGLDSSGDEISEDITMDGTDAVTSSLSYSFVHRVYVLTTGTNLTNVGNITVTNSSSAQTLAYVEADAGTTLQLIYKVPTGYKLILDRINVGAPKGDNIDLEIRVKPNGGA